MTNRVVRTALLVLCLLAAAVPAASAAPSDAPDVYEVDGMLESLEKAIVEGKGTWTITLVVEGRQASAPLASGCKFYVNGEETPIDGFIQQALHRDVTVEFHDAGNEASVCRATVYYVN